MEEMENKLLVMINSQKERGATYKQLVPGLVDVAMALLTRTLNFNIYFFSLK